MFGLGPAELIVIFLIIFLLFGAKALPEIAKGVGQALRIFNKEVKDASREVTSAIDEASMDEKKEKSIELSSNQEEHQKQI